MLGASDLAWVFIRHAKITWCHCLRVQEALKPKIFRMVAALAMWMFEKEKWKDIEENIAETFIEFCSIVWSYKHAWTFISYQQYAKRKFLFFFDLHLPSTLLIVIMKATMLFWLIVSILYIFLGQYRFSGFSNLVKESSTFSIFIVNRYVFVANFVLPLPRCLSENHLWKKQLVYLAF